MGLYLGLSENGLAQSGTKIAIISTRDSHHLEDIRLGKVGIKDASMGSSCPLVLAISGTYYIHVELISCSDNIPDEKEPEEVIVEENRMKLGAEN